MGLSALTGDATEDTQAGQILQKKFADNLKHRIDARIVKNLKRTKRMKIKDLVEQVIGDLNLQMVLDQNQEQLDNLKKQIDKQVHDLAVKEFVKIVEGAEKQAEYLAS